MTLIVSLRTVDGIVLAGDSLSTLMRSPEIQGDVDVQCPNCGHDHTIQTTLQGPSLPATTLSFAQKIFPFLDTYGVGTYGAGQVAGKTAYFAIRELEAEIADDMTLEPGSLVDAANLIGDRIHTLIEDQADTENFDLTTWHPDYMYIGLQVVGYETGEPVTYIVRVGQTVSLERSAGLDVSVTGKYEVYNALHALYMADPQSIPLIEQFSLQDAIAYAQFLIRTTALHQQFSRVIPSVGGDIDVAVVTPFDRFRWIQQKPLYRRMEAT